MKVYDILVYTSLVMTVIATFMVWISVFYGHHVDEVVRKTKVLECKAGNIKYIQLLTSGPKCLLIYEQGAKNE